MRERSCSRATENYKQQTRTPVYVKCGKSSWPSCLRVWCAFVVLVAIVDECLFAFAFLVATTTMTTQDVGQRNATIDQPKEIIKWFFTLWRKFIRSLYDGNGCLAHIKLFIIRPTRHCCSEFCFSIFSRCHKKRTDDGDDDVDDDDDDDDADDGFFNPTHFNRTADFPHLGLPVCARLVCFHNFRFGLCGNEFSTRRWHTWRDSVCTPTSTPTPTTDDRRISIWWSRCETVNAEQRMFHHFCLSVSRAMPIPLRSCFCVHSVGLCIQWDSADGYLSGGAYVINFNSFAIATQSMCVCVICSPLVSGWTMMPSEVMFWVITIWEWTEKTKYKHSLNEFNLILSMIRSILSCGELHLRILCNDECDLRSKRHSSSFPIWVKIGKISHSLVRTRNGFNSAPYAVRAQGANVQTVIYYQLAHKLQVSLHLSRSLSGERI